MPSARIREILLIGSQRLMMPSARIRKILLIRGQRKGNTQFSVSPACTLKRTQRTCPIQNHDNTASHIAPFPDIPITLRIAYCVLRIAYYVLRKGVGSLCTL